MHVGRQNADTQSAVNFAPTKKKLMVKAAITIVKHLVARLGESGQRLFIKPAV